MFRLRFIDRLKFFVERQFVKGASYQLLIVVAVIGLISLLGGMLVLPIGDYDEHLGNAVWWAFLRLTDPGYLGDDEGTWRRIVSTWLTVSGYVVFLGALVAIMTRWLIAIMEHLELGLTPVSLKNHIVILGWNNRTVPLLRELVMSTSRLGRFMRERDIKRLKIVVLSEQVSSEQIQLLRADPGIGRRSKDIILRSGSPLQPEALHRVACLQAAAVIIPNESHGPDSLVTSDVESLKALLSIYAQAREREQPLPFVVMEVEDVRKFSVASRAYPGPLEIVAGDATISRLLAQNIIHPGLSELYGELLTAHAGNELYIRPAAPYAGLAIAELEARCPDAIMFGLLRPGADGDLHTHLNVASDEILTKADALVLMARSFDETEPEARAPSERRVNRRVTIADPEAPPVQQRKRLLILGWNRRVPAIITELASYQNYEFDVDLVSIVPADIRTADIARYSEVAGRVVCDHVEADYMVEGELRRLNPARYDSIVLLSSDRLSSGEEADARAIVGYLVLEEILQGQHRQPQILLELSDPANEDLLASNSSETIISPMILSHMLSQVTLRRELRLVYDELFTAHGAEIQFYDPSEYDLPLEASFSEFEGRAAALGETALGIYRSKADLHGKRLQLNPVRDKAMDLVSGDQLVALITL
ncbi:MAG: ion channel DMI1 [Gammaproteobacteria bacterium]|nr:ion channel DMI1 [Gammaproteobacteria bacterium]|tara:strand:- start:2449 stop:4401 length:1953 start_codon:yes stop_codon:yes gene_type:complete